MNFCLAFVPIFSTNYYPLIVILLFTQSFLFVEDKGVEPLTSRMQI
jgi:hypothetical protein